MTIRWGDPASVTIPTSPTWAWEEDTAVHHLARDFAGQAYSNSKKISALFEQISTRLEQVEALPGGRDAAFEIDAAVGQLSLEISALASMIGVEVAYRFKPADVWRTLATERAKWAEDWGEEQPRDSA
ncbi:MAG TPA: hypothetical protein VIU62_13590 [Chloroflexota bacterium]|jgi:hypothetical protein